MISKKQGIDSTTIKLQRQQDESNERSNSPMVMEEVEIDTSVQASNPKEYISKKIERGKSYYRATVLVTGLLFLLNFVLLYFGTIFGEERINVSKFYGFKEGKQEHLQRTNGIFCFIMFLVNIMPLLKDEKHGKNSMLAFSAVCNVVVILHYLLESLYFVGMRLEVISIQGFILLVNLYWSITDYHQRRKMKVLTGRNPEEAHRDVSLRDKVQQLKKDKKVTTVA